jgi:hypothetical protein
VARPVLGRHRPRIRPLVILNPEKRLVPGPVQALGGVDEHEVVRGPIEHELERVIGRRHRPLGVSDDEAADVERPAEPRPLRLLPRRELVDGEAVVAQHEARSETRRAGRYDDRYLDRCGASEQ